MSIQRREFLAGVGAILLAGHVRAAEAEKMRAVVIGHTGKGDYGHGLDMVFHDQPTVEFVALADEDDAGRVAAVKKCKPPRNYANWREMLEKEKPNLVSIAPRQTGERMEMLTAALSAGAHVICEKPFVRSPADGDFILDLARRKNLKIAVSHQMRIASSILFLKKKIDEGLIGELLEIRAWGKQDHRVGGEDMTVLGVHLFDQMRLFAGEPQWCSARVLEHSHEATISDVKQATEDLGPILGSDIDAQFAFDKGVLGTFTSRAGLLADVEAWGLELIGSKAAARILANMWPRILIRQHAKWDDAGRTDEWRPIEGDPAAAIPAKQRNGITANRRLVDDWLAAISENRDPVCSGHNAARAVEMSHAVWRAALTGGRVTLPLKDRRHALDKKE